MLCKCGLCRSAYAVMRCPSVRPSRSCILSKQINVSSNFFTIGSQTILVFPAANAMAIFRRAPPDGGVEYRWGRQKSRSQPVSGSVACCELFDRQVHAIHSAATDNGKLMTLVAGKQWSLLMAEDEDEVFTTKSLNVTRKTTEQHLIVRIGESEA